MLVPESIHTERLLLRVPVQHDAEDILRVYASDPEVTRFLTWAPVSELSDVQTGIAQRIRRHRAGAELSWVITSLETRELMGMIALQANGLFLECGFVLGRSFWHQGFMVEALKAIAGWALTQPDVFRIWASCHTGNHASGRVLEKAGFLREGTLQRWVVLPNFGKEPVDCLYYALDRRIIDAAIYSTYSAKISWE